MTDKLSVYNGALGHLGARSIASLSEARESRRVLDWAWARGIVDRALAAGMWDWAARSVMVDYSESIEPAFGLARAFNKPEDHVRTLAVCSDEFFKTAILNYQNEGDYWYADEDTIYVRYVSNGASYGADYGKWPPNFTAYVELLLAADCAKKITGGRSDGETLREQARDMLTTAKNLDAMEGPSLQKPLGSWTRARYGGGSNRDDRGSRTNLIG